MADPDNSPKSFLERWSRKKIESERNIASTPAGPTPESEAAGLPARAAATDAKAPDQVATKPEFDLASLPSLDSITATTDIRAFLSPGVPKELARAALRRAWAADPSIRDFKGLAENDWDFTDPAAMPGFGGLPEGYDVKKLVAEMFSTDKKTTEPSTAEAQPPVPQPAAIAAETEPPIPAEQVAPSMQARLEAPQPKHSDDARQITEGSFLQRNNIAASHNSSSEEEPEERKSRRQHGGALPQ